MSIRRKEPAIEPTPVYVATVRLTTKDGRVLAMPGETCERVPASSLPWLIDQGLIVRKEQD